MPALIWRANPVIEPKPPVGHADATWQLRRAVTATPSKVSRWPVGILPLPTPASPGLPQLLPLPVDAKDQPNSGARPDIRRAARSPAAIAQAEQSMQRKQRSRCEPGKPPPRAGCPLGRRAKVPTGADVPDSFGSHSAMTGRETPEPHG